jgi:hypothetical protein
MRVVVAVLAGVIGVAPSLAQEPKVAPRYKVEADLKTYPQGSAKEVLASVLKALDNKRIDYLLAHLADPKWVDERVAIFGGKFAEVLKEARTQLADNPAEVKLLRRFLEKGEWQLDEATATVRLADIADRRVYLRKLDGRWFFESRWKPTSEAKDKQ